MKRRSWKIWVAGIALAQLLVVGVEVALLWPDRSEAEEAAAPIQVGMTAEQYQEVHKSIANSRWTEIVGGSSYEAYDYMFDDGSRLVVTVQPINGAVTSIRASASKTVPPLTRLRRTLARALPFLAE